MLNSVDKHEFKIILGYFNIKCRPMTIDRLFWVLDVNQTELLEPYDIIMSFQFFLLK